jgi:hypothetical protein
MMRPGSGGSVSQPLRRGRMGAWLNDNPGATPTVSWGVLVDTGALILSDGVFLKMSLR